MFLVLTHKKSLKKKSIIGIFDIDTSSQAAPTREFLRAEQAKGRLFSCTDSIPRSFILCDDETLFSGFLTSTLKDKASYGIK